MQLDKAKQKLGAFGVIGETFRNHGFLGFYRGYSSLLIFNMPKNSVRFYTYEWAATNVFKEKSQMNTFLCGIVAGATEAVLVVTPQETIKTKLIHDKLSAVHKYKNIFHGISTIYKDKGPSGLYAGVVPTVIKQSTNQGVRFVVFADTKERLQPYLRNKVFIDLLSGAFAGFCSTMFNNPIDVIKTKMQGVNTAKMSVMGHAADIFATRGFLGFYSGIGPRLVRVMLDAALTFSLFH